MIFRPAFMGFLRAASLIGAAAVALPASSAAVLAQDKDISIYFVGCAAPTGFHGYLARGAEEAGKNLGVKVTYIYPDQLTIPNQVQKIEEAIAAKADGIALCEFAEDAAYTEVAAARQGGRDRLRQRRRAASRHAGPRSRTTFSCSAPAPMSGPPASSPPSHSSPWASRAGSSSATSNRVTPPAAIVPMRKSRR